MESVAKYLVDQARLKTGEDQDLFTRSAFNRYYYACFRIVWRLHKEIYPNSRVPGHKQLPEKIESDLFSLFKRRAQEARRKGLLDHGDVARLQRSARILTSNLSNILKIGYGVRCVADYELETLTYVTGSNLKLDNTTIEEASNWVRRVNQLCGEITASWRSLGN